MKLKARIVVLAAAMGMVIPVVTAKAQDDPDPVDSYFRNPAQAQHELNLAQENFTDADVETRALESYVQDQAKDEIEEKIVAHADSVVQAKGEEAAAMAYAETEAKEANPDPESDAYKDVYAEAFSEAQAWSVDDDTIDQTYSDAYADWYAEYGGAEEGSIWDGAYKSAEARAYGEWNGPNAYDSALERIKQETKAIPEEELESYYMAALKSISGEQLDVIRYMRYDMKMGLGRIARELGIHPKVIGLGHTKIKGMEVEVPEIDPAEDLDVDPIEAEMMQATQRIKRTNWEKGNGNVNRNNKKNTIQTMGLTETSTAAAGASSGNKGKGNAGKSWSGVGVNKSDKSNNVNNGKSSSSKSDKNDRGNSGKNDKNDRGNSGNNGKNDKNDRGNNGNNGKNDKNDRGNNGNGKK